MACDRLAAVLLRQLHCKGPVVDGRQLRHCRLLRRFHHTRSRWRFADHHHPTIESHCQDYAVVIRLSLAQEAFRKLFASSLVTEMTPPPYLVGLVGFARVGKDTFANALVKAHGFKQMAFADRLRQVAYKLGKYLYVGLSIFGDSSSETYTEAIDRLGYETVKRLYPNARKFLVDIGHGFREVFGPSFWIDQVVQQIEGEDCESNIVITDCRYLNEALTVRNLGGVIVYLERPGQGAANDTEAASIAEIVGTNDVIDCVVVNDARTAETFEAQVATVFYGWLQQWSRTCSSVPTRIVAC